MKRHRALNFAMEISKQLTLPLFRTPLERLPYSPSMDTMAGTKSDKTISRIDIGEFRMQKLCNIVPADPMNHAFMLEY